MAQLPAVTEEEFLVNRAEFLHGFIKFSTYTAGAIIVLLVLMGITLV